MQCRNDEKKPRRIAALRGIEIQQISTGGWHCLALDSAGLVYAWGGNEYGQCHVEWAVRCALLKLLAMPHSQIAPKLWVLLFQRLCPLKAQCYPCHPILMWQVHVVHCMLFIVCCYLIAASMRQGHLSHQPQHLVPVVLLRINHRGLQKSTLKSTWAPAGMWWSRRPVCLGCASSRCQLAACTPACSQTLAR